MSHARFFARLTAIVYWLVNGGALFAMTHGLGNAHAIGFFTWLIYGVGAVLVLYIGYFMTKQLWSIK